MTERAVRRDLEGAGCVAAAEEVAEITDRAADLCCGSGAVGAHLLATVPGATVPGATVVGTDIDDDAAV